MKEGASGPAGFAKGSSLGNSYTSGDGSELNFHKQEHPCKGQACRALCASATGRDCLPISQQHLQVTSKAVTKLQGNLWVFCFPHFSDSLLERNAHFFIECHSRRKIGHQV
ncbi:unnamed protein product [Rangifer tarandus platyrhynchus]|uniref:Uncharacterized protein n=1 Tax=Rangifer tarandus platyrhynchus TaxID=3082113 RepID=A0AC59Z2P4_RANTA